MKRVVIAVAVLLPVCACSYPNTDITATNTERVGNYEIVNTRPGDSFEADVCVDEPARVNAIAERVTHQLANHGYRAITLNMYGRSGPIARVETKDGQTQRYGLTTNTTAVSCAPKTGAMETR